MNFAPLQPIPMTPAELSAAVALLRAMIERNCK